MKIRFEDYLPDEERKAIISDVFRSVCEEKFREDYERIVSNAAYETVRKMVDELHGKNVDELIAKKAIEVINGLSSYTVFREKDVWDREESQGAKSLREAILSNKLILQEKVRTLIEGLDESVIKETLRDYACELLEDRLFGGKKS